MTNHTFTIFIPTRNVAVTIEETLESIYRQTYQNFNIVIQDNGSVDDTEKIIKKHQQTHSNIIFHKNGQDIGPKSFFVARQYFSGEITFIMAADDILGKDALYLTNQAFNNPNVGAVTRPYYWFTQNIFKPIRAKKTTTTNKNETLTIRSDFSKIITLISTIDQISGLAFRTKLIPTEPFLNAWTTFPYLFLSIFKNNPVVMLNSYTVAVRISPNNDSRQRSTFIQSPMIGWISMLTQVFNTPQTLNLKTKLIQNFVAINYIGLIQIRNFGGYKLLLREIFYLIKYRPLNLIHPIFWLLVTITLITPPIILIPLAQWYKEKIYAKTLKHLNLDNFHD